MTRISLLLLSLTLWLPLGAQQITGVVTDAETGEAIPMASVVYQSHHVAVISDIDGNYAIPRHEGWNITFSSVGYKSRPRQTTAGRGDHQV